MADSKKDNVPGWIKDALRVLRPPDKMTVSEWAEKNRVLDNKTSAAPGPWRNAVTPYLVGVMDAFNDPTIEEIIFCMCTQIGGTEAANNIFGYIVAQDPSPTLIVYPTILLAEFTSKNRLQPMIKLSPDLREKYIDDETKILELQFDGMYAVLAGSNSETSLASRPVGVLILDEIDKYSRFAGKEGDPISLAKERQKTYTATKKTFMTSTPTYRNGNIWRYMQNADEKREYYVPCPHCGHFQTLRFKQVKWPDVKDITEVKDKTHYICENCNGIITDRHKPKMLSNGEWRAEHKKKNASSVAFHINTIYSPWVRFGDVAYEFLRSKDDPALLMNFVNSWLAEPWEDTKAKTNSDNVMERQDGIEEAVVPNDAVFLTGGVDVQKDCMYYTIRAWGYGMTSWNITHGICESWEQVENVMNTRFYSPDGREYIVNLGAIDSGDQTDTVYQFCAYNQEWAIPVKGSSKKLTSPYNRSIIDKGQSIANGMALYIVDGSYYKDLIFSRMRRPNGIGSWMVYQGCDQNYAEQICAEEKVLLIKNGKEIEEWQKKSAHIDNHYLDCEVYAALCADLLNVRYLTKEKAEAEQKEKPKAKPVETKNNGWLSGGKGWLR